MEPTVSNQISSPNSHQNMRNFIYGIVGLLLVSVILITGIGIFRVYHQAATDRFSTLIARFWHLPIAKVNGQTIPYYDYVTDLAAINIKSAYDQARQGPTADLTAAEKSDQVIWRLVNNALINEAAKKFNLTVTPADTKEIREKILAKFQTAAAADAQLSSEYGWDLATYEQKVVIPFVLGNKIVQTLEVDPAIRHASRSLTQSILDQIKAGADFGELAQKYGEDATGPEGGDLGWFARGTMVPQFENTVFALKKGELSPDILETTYGFHVIQSDDSRITKIKDKKTGKMVNEQEIKARHILIRFASLTRFLNEVVKNADLHLYANVHNPFLEIKKM